ncbi:MAG: anaerobic sulfatase maturase [Bacteroidota bacterium]
MKNVSREFQVLVKPVGAQCNLSCTYCYYLDKKDLAGDCPQRHMPVQILERYISQHIEATTADTVRFSWHGGEPLLAGIDFFRKITELQGIYMPAGKDLMNGLQTNGILIDDAWCRFFSDNNFSVGLSIDGPSFLHDVYRRTAGGSSTFHRVKAAYLLLKEYGIHTETLCVVNAENVMYPLQVYDFFRALGAEYITFIPLVERNNDGSVADFSVPPEEYGAFLAAIFDRWKAHDIGHTRVQIFEEALRSAFRQDHTLCIFKKTCGGVPVMEINGDLYSCDHYVDSHHLVGNINDSSLADMLDCARQKDFGRQKLSTLPSFCLECGVRDMCNGGCPKNRFVFSPAGEPGLNYLCPGYKIIFGHIKLFAAAVEKVWKQGL